LRDFIAAHLWHAYVEKHYVWMVTACYRERRMAIVDRPDILIHRFQQRVQGVGCIVVIVDHQ
jgi:hypothetical protein